MYYVYILKSSVKSKYYIGATNELPNKRLSEHNTCSNTWTRANKPFELTYYENYYCKTDALYREKFLKSGQGRKLVKLIIDNF